MWGRIAAAALVALVLPTAATAQVQPYRTGDAGGFRDVLPPGTNGRLNLVELAAFLGGGPRPAHNDDQLQMYAGLIKAVPGLRTEDLGRFYKDASFGVRPDDLERTYSPRGDVTIQRDASFGVPHVYGTTRAGAMFGLGYIAAEDRLFLIDALRNAGRAQVTSFAGGSPGNREMDQGQWQLAPYTEEDLQAQLDALDDLYGPAGKQVQDDIANYTDGVNAHIREARNNLLLMPGEYAALGRGGPEDWRPTDIVATASLVGGIFGKGGGRELEAATFLQALRKRYGSRTGRRLWEQLMGYHDEDAPTTVQGKRFPYQTAPRRPPRGAEVLPDAGSLKPEPVVVGGVDAPSGAPRNPALAFGFSGAMSNALVVSRRLAAGGRPLAVFGPQTGYFQPEILMEQDVHAPTLDARGAAFPGVNLYVQLGRGRDYSWSATSAGQDIIDTYAVPLCEPDGKAPTTASVHYRFRGACEPMEKLERTNSWQPSLADSTAAGTQTLRAYRTKLGIVRSRGTVKRKPVAFTVLRSTYRHEVDSAIGFSDLNDPAKIPDARAFQRAASRIGYTFNWFYVDDRDTAYFNSGNNPLRRRGVTGRLPVDPRHEWRGFDPARNTARYTPSRQHPQARNQDVMTNWNNKQAPGYAGGDGNLFSGVARAQMLDEEIAARTQNGRRMTLPDLVEAMAEAATTDLRGEAVLPLALRVLGSPRDPDLAAAVRTLGAWVAAGAHRRDRDTDGRYDHNDAVRIMDAWWPRWVKAQFEPVLGKTAYDAIPHEIDNAPNNHGGHLGSAYEKGFYGYVWKDLRRTLALPVKQRYAKRFCGRLSRCRALLERTLKEALAIPHAEVYPADGQCAAGDQPCFDAIAFRALGGATQPMIPWQNRPTYQQAVEVQGHRPR